MENNFKVMAECALWQRFGSNGSLVREFLRKLVGDEGLKILEAVPEGEVTDEELAKLSLIHI